MTKGSGTAPSIFLVSMLVVCVGVTNSCAPKKVVRALDVELPSYSNNFDAKYDEVWGAVVGVLRARSIPIAGSQEDLGLIVTHSRELADSLAIGTLGTPVKSRVFFLVTPLSTEATRLDILVHSVFSTNNGLFPSYIENVAGGRAWFSRFMADVRSSLENDG